ncbi:spore germination protein GerPC [Peribacillus simplex]|uniref:Spore germination protein GerPC n=1 Tax=Peribacillus simplex TaxID=1478 RepID=A0A9W4KUV8_9BACI|nr:spore germination protein GerPC [Peribacillus simplex]MDR4927132.1 spore germination protein GerPC [Peribacillus simplex]WHX92417.1 spore germination protein GerPC [Peribacillus simplex]CAH0159292.1 putative spore germination protein GerPC [Peribacillus simplex]
MNQDLYSYSIQMQRFLEAQDKRIMKLEHELKRLTDELAELKNKPPIHVDKIEYKFDQLKVESLDGTLNIGLNPTDLNNIDEFAVNNQPVQPAPNLFPGREIIVQEIHNDILSDLENMINDAENQLKISLEPSYHDFIRQDVERQLHQRINMYFDNLSYAERAPQQRDNIKEKIREKVKSDIQTALLQFITHSQAETGGNPNGV